MAQMNNESGTSRKMRRAGDIDTGGDEDAGFAGALDTMTGTSETAGLSGGASFAPELTMSLSDAVIAKQKKLGAQSLRGGIPLDYGPAVSADKHGSSCFDKMLENEAEFAGGWWWVGGGCVNKLYNKH